MPIFDASRLKVERAKRHVDELVREVSAYLERDPYVGLKMRDTTSGEYFISSMSRELPPSIIAVVFGDILFNLRSSLDLLANDLVYASGSTPKGVYFPFAASEAELEGQIASKLRGANSEIIELVRAYEPFRGGNEDLRALHDLNIRDKHIELLGTGAGQSVIFSAENMEFVAPNALVSRFDKMPSVPIDPAGFPVREGTEIVGKLVDSTSFVHIGPNLPLAGQDILEVARRLVEIVADIIDTFEAHCSASQRQVPK